LEIKPDEKKNRKEIKEDNNDNSKDSSLNEEVIADTPGPECYFEDQV